MTRYRRDPRTWELVEVPEDEEAEGEGAEVEAAGDEIAEAEIEAPYEETGAEPSSDPDAGPQPQADADSGQGESSEPAEGADGAAAEQAAEGDATEADDDTPADFIDAEATTASGEAVSEALLSKLDPEQIPHPRSEDLDPVEIPELHEVDCPDDLREEIEELMARYPQKRSASIPALWAVQRRYGWCTPEGIRQAAAVMQITPAYLESVASFYDLLRLEPIGEGRVLVCTNISCWMRGADELLESFCDAAGIDPHEAGHGGATSADGKVFVSGFECLGACDIAPMASINERYFGPLENDEAKTAIDQLRSGGAVLPDKALSKRPAAGGNPEPDPRVAG